MTKNLLLILIGCTWLYIPLDCNASNSKLIPSDNELQHKLQENMNPLIEDVNFTWDQMKKCASFPAITVDSTVYKKFNEFCKENKMPYTKRLIDDLLTTIYQLATEIVYNVVETYRPNLEALIDI